MFRDADMYAEESALQAAIDTRLADEPLARDIIAMMDRAADRTTALNRCYHALQLIRDSDLRRRIFLAIRDVDHLVTPDARSHDSSHRDIFYLDGVNPADIWSRYLRLKVTGPVTINGDFQCQIPVNVSCSDGYGDIWQNVEIYDDDAHLGRRHIDYLDHYEDTITLPPSIDSFRLFRLNTSYSLDASPYERMALVGVDTGAAAEHTPADVEASNWARLMDCRLFMDVPGTPGEPSKLSFTLEIGQDRYPYETLEWDNDYYKGKTVYFSMESAARARAEATAYPISQLLGATLLLTTTRQDGTPCECRFPFPPQIAQLADSCAINNTYLSLPGSAEEGFSFQLKPWTCYFDELDIQCKAPLQKEELLSAALLLGQTRYPYQVRSRCGAQSHLVDSLELTLPSPLWPEDLGAVSPFLDASLVLTLRQTDGSAVEHLLPLSLPTETLYDLAPGKDETGSLTLISKD